MKKKKKYIVNSYYKAITKLDVQLILWVHTWTVIEIAISQLGTAGKTVGNHIKIWSGKRCSMGRKSRVRKESCNKFFFFCFVNTPSYTVSKRSSLWSVERFYYSYKIIATTTAAWKLLKKKKILSKSVLYKRSGVVVEKSFASESMQETWWYQYFLVTDSHPYSTRQ